MDKIRIYVLVLCSVVGLGSCDFLERNKPLVMEIGKAVVNEIESEKTASASKAVHVKTFEGDEALLMQAEVRREHTDGMTSPTMRCIMLDISLRVL